MVLIPYKVQGIAWPTNLALWILSQDFTHAILTMLPPPSHVLKHQSLCIL